MNLISTRLTRLISLTETITYETNQKRRVRSVVCSSDSNRVSNRTSPNEFQLVLRKGQAMTKRINARLAMNEIVHKREFNAGNFWGRWTDDDTQYQVYSYRQLIGTFHLADETWILDKDKYSMTTSKHQNYLKRAVNTPDLALV